MLCDHASTVEGKELSVSCSACQAGRSANMCIVL